MNARIAVVAAAALLSLTACGGGKSSASPSDTYPPLSTTAPEQSGAPLPKIDPAQVKGLIGVWTNTTRGNIKDTFTFKADGTGVWEMSGKTLWSGQVIPLGKLQFRLSWLGKDPQVASYWAVQLTSDGKLLFQGNQATYARTAAASKSPAAGRSPGASQSPKG